MLAVTSARKVNAMDDSEVGPWSVKQRLRTPFYYYGVASFIIVSLAAGIVEPGPVMLVLVLTGFSTLCGAVLLAVVMPRPTPVGTKNGPLVLGISFVFLSGAVVIRMLNN
jgi:hypothetical protein